MSKEIIFKKGTYDTAAAESFAADYISFLTNCKTERECVAYFVKELEAQGAKSLESVIESGKAPAPGDVIYFDMMHKALLAIRIGRKAPSEGFRVLGAHVDSPRLDLKPNPLYEESGMVYLDTHYYGGIKKYQWTALPMAIHGIVVKTDGSVVNINIGENIKDPVVSITDLLPHLGKAQMQKTLAEAIPGEGLDLLTGTMPLAGASDDEKEPVKANILALLKETYGIEEDDLFSAELEVVPAGPAREHGLDRSMIMAYGQDDRVCAYTSYRAFVEMKDVEYTSLCLFTDKEEIGSVGATGMHSRFFEDALLDLFSVCGCGGSLELRRAFRKTKVLSSDVSAGYDPFYPEVMDKKNTSYLGYGPVIIKYQGSGGKAGSNDANAEYIGYLRKVLGDAGVSFQMAENGKVDAGGSGTIAYILANLGMDVIDFGTPVLNMHAPYEITSKADVYETYKAYKAFIA